MSKLRGNPQGHKCSVWLGHESDTRYFVAGIPTHMNNGREFQDRGMCQDSAVIRCNRCKKYFCEECWIDHLHGSVNTTDGIPDDWPKGMPYPAPREPLPPKVVTK